MDDSKSEVWQECLRGSQDFSGTVGRAWTRAPEPPGPDPVQRTPRFCEFGVRPLRSWTTRSYSVKWDNAHNGGRL